MYRYVNGVVIAKMPEEIQAEIDALPVPEDVPDKYEKLEAMTYYIGMMTGVL